MQRDPALEAVFMPVYAPSTFEETIERLGAAIRLGLLVPGSKLPSERELAGELGIARSTLRQALCSLVESGYLVSKRGRKGGTFVAEEPPGSGVDEGLLGQGTRAVLDYRVAVECGAVLLAAERGEGDELPQLEEMIERMDEQVGDFDEFRRVDVRFHIAIAEVARSPRLVGAMTEVQVRMIDLMAATPGSEAELEHSNEGHRLLVEAVREGDGPRAVKLMRGHIEVTEEVLFGLLPS